MDMERKRTPKSDQFLDVPTIYSADCLLALRPVVSKCHT